MKIFGIELSWRRKGALQSVPSNGSWLTGWAGPIMEAFSGAWQRNVVVDSRECILAFSAVFACVTRIASDIAKMQIRLLELLESGIWTEVGSKSPFWRVLRKPNGFQTRYQFVECWIISKLLSGNAYILLVRDDRKVVREMYVLDPRRVQPLVAADGSVYYQLSEDNLAGLEEPVTVPASEVIHDRMNCLFHPLVGVSPIYACGVTATLGNKIQNNSAKFFENMSRPSGMLTAPGQIDNETAQRMKLEFETKFGGGNLGRLFVAGNGLKYEPMTINAVDAQLIEQLKWTVEDVARAFGVPLYKIGAGAMPALTNIEAVNQQYYTDCIQSMLEAAEGAVDVGFGFVSAEDRPYRVQFDVQTLFRMDTATRFKAISDAIAGGWLAPNEGRKWENLPPKDGGDSPMMQQQNWSLAQLADRRSIEDSKVVAPPQPALPAPSEATDEVEDEARAFYAVLLRGIETLPTPEMA